MASHSGPKIIINLISNFFNLFSHLAPQYPHSIHICWTSELELFSLEVVFLPSLNLICLNSITPPDSIMISPGWRHPPAPSKVIPTHSWINASAPAYLQSLIATECSPDFSDVQLSKALVRKQHLYPLLPFSFKGLTPSFCYYSTTYWIFPKCAVGQGSVVNTHRINRSATAICKCHLVCR